MRHLDHDVTCRNVADGHDAQVLVVLGRLLDADALVAIMRLLACVNVERGRTR